MFDTVRTSQQPRGLNAGAHHKKTIVVGELLWTIRHPELFNVTLTCEQTPGRKT